MGGSPATESIESGLGSGYTRDKTDSNWLKKILLNL